MPVSMPYILKIRHRAQRSDNVFLYLYMPKWFIDIRSVVSLYTSVCNYSELLNSGPMTPKYVGNQLQYRQLGFSP